MLKLAVMNNSGNVGKTMISELLLQPRIPEAEIISIETINGDTEGGYRASDFIEITRKIISCDNCIVDIGASNIELFSQQMMDYPDTQEYIDFFIIPVTPTAKQQLDSAKTVSFLLDFGIEKDKIRFILNRNTKGKHPDTEFFQFLTDTAIKSLNILDYPLLPETEIFHHLANANKKFLEVLADTRDFRSLILKSEDPDERAALAEERAITGLAKRFTGHLDRAFQKLHLEI